LDSPQETQKDKRHKRKIICVFGRSTVNGDGSFAGAEGDTKQTKNDETNGKSLFFRLFRSFSFVSYSPLASDIDDHG
jgi:hypothetical protein